MAISSLSLYFLKKEIDGESGSKEVMNRELLETINRMREDDHNYLGSLAWGDRYSPNRILNDVRHCNHWGVRKFSNIKLKDIIVPPNDHIVYELLEFDSHCSYHREGRNTISTGWREVNPLYQKPKNSSLPNSIELPD